MTAGSGIEQRTASRPRSWGGAGCNPATQTPACRCPCALQATRTRTLTSNPNPNPNFNQVTGLTPEAEEAQEYLMKLPVRFNKLAQRQAKSLAKKPREPKEWAWLNGRVV